jgi:hypothetical protein
MFKLIKNIFDLIPKESPFITQMRIRNLLFMTAFKLLLDEKKQMTGEK